MLDLRQGINGLDKGIQGIHPLHTGGGGIGGTEVTVLQARKGNIQRQSVHNLDVGL